MERRLTAAALMVPLMLATPALAQMPADDRSDVSNSLLGPTYLPSDTNARALPSLAGPRRTAASPSFAQESGPGLYGHKLVAAMPVAKDVHIGLGLMSVSRYSPREPDFKRAPMKDVEGRRQRIAAVGLSLSF